MDEEQVPPSHEEWRGRFSERHANPMRPLARMLVAEHEILRRVRTSALRMHEMTPHKMIEQLLTDEGMDSSVAIDGILALGAEAIAALVAALKEGRGVPQLTALLSALPLTDPVRDLAPLLADGDEVRNAALRALGDSGDPGALPILVAALPTSRFVASEALGNLGRTEARVPLLGLVAEYVGSDGSMLPTGDLLTWEYSCMDLRVVAKVAAAMAKLGDETLAPVAIRLATLRHPGEIEDANLVRAAAAAALRYVTAPGVASALHAAALDRDADAARAALLGTLYLGRPDEVEVWLKRIAKGGVVGREALSCLESWSGSTFAGDRPVRGEDVRRWWLAEAGRYPPGTCFRSGRPTDIGELVRRLTQEGEDLRFELRIRTGAACFHDGLSGYPPSPREITAIDDWWQSHAGDFPLGKLHRWGRSFDPTVVS